MDKMFDIGKEFLQERMQQGEPQHQQHQQQQHHQQQGHGGQYEHRLPPGDKAHGGGYPIGGNSSYDEDFSNVHEEAARYSGGSGSSDMFSSIMGAIQGNKGSLANEDFDEEDAIRKHQQVYSNGHHADESSMGTAAAMQALQHFVSGKPGQQQSQSGILSIAMAEAAKLFDKSSSEGNCPPGASKESVVQKAGEFAMKMYMKKQMESPQGMMDLASKFLR